MNRKIDRTIVRSGSYWSNTKPDPRGPFFLTQWEREDYEREQRGEKPLGPTQSNGERNR